MNSSTDPNYLSESPNHDYLSESLNHDYLSTSCYHNEHEYCKTSVISPVLGTKIPAKCKFCDAKCRCTCHGFGSDGPEQLRQDEQMELF